MSKFIRPLIELIPAYGRTYANPTAVIEAWKEGRDFQDVLTGQYCSIRDLDFMQTKMDTEMVYVRSNYDLVTVWEVIT